MAGDMTVEPQTEESRLSVVSGQLQSTMDHRPRTTDHRPPPTAHRSDLFREHAVRFLDAHGVGKRLFDDRPLIECVPRRRSL